MNNILMFSLNLQWGLREVYFYNALGCQQAQNVLGSVPLVCMSNKHHAVGKYVTVKLSCSLQSYLSHEGNSLSACLWRHMCLRDSCTATICWRGSSWQDTSWISHSKWQLGDARVFSHSGSPQPQVYIYYSSLCLRNRMNFYTGL